MQNQYTNNSVNIGNGNDLSAAQFANGSTNFSGVTNQKNNEFLEVENLTNALIETLKNETNIVGANTEEIIDAINQIAKEMKKSKLNKLSVNGIISGIREVMTNLSGVSVAAWSIYEQWHDVISATISKL